MREGGKNRRKPVTAEELAAELAQDPEYVAQRAERDRERTQRESEWREAEAPLVEELRKTGVNVQSAWDLVNTSTPYPEALPILLEHLSRPYPDRVREGIARALAVRDAKFGWPTLVQLYERESAGTDAKDGLAVAIAAAADDDVIEDVIGLAQEARHGESRTLLLPALARSRDQRVLDALKNLERDAALTTEARRLLKRTK